MKNIKTKYALEEFISKRLSELKGRVIFFFGDKDIFSFSDLDGIIDGTLFFALKNAEWINRVPDQIPREKLLFYRDPDFIDRAKNLTGEKGFENVIVLDSDPETIKSALGVAGILGAIYLLSPPSGPVTVDLHNTIHYKSLRVIGHQFSDY